MAAAPPIPSWLRRAVHEPHRLGNQGFEDVAIAAGAAIGALDQIMRVDQKWAGVWR